MSKVDELREELIANWCVIHNDCAPDKGALPDVILDLLIEAAKVEGAAEMRERCVYVVDDYARDWPTPSRLHLTARIRGLK